MADLLGTKRFLEAALPQLGVTLQLTDEMIEKVGATADELGVFLGGATDLVKGLDGIVHAFPEQWQAIVREAVLLLSRGREAEAAVLRLIFKASRKLDAIPDSLFPLTVGAPKGDVR
jgi:hypothetical protein